MLKGVLRGCLGFARASTLGLIGVGVGCLALVGLVTLGLIGAMILTFPVEGKSGPSPTPPRRIVGVPPAPPRAAEEAFQTPPPGDALRPGTAVEITAPIIAADRSIFDALRSGVDPRRFQPGPEKFGVPPGGRARVVEQQGDAVHIIVEDKHWNGRHGWISREFARTVPAEDESKADVKHGLTLLERRELYGEAHRAGMLAIFEADRRVGTLPDDPEEPLKHKAVYDAFKFELNKKLCSKYGVTREQLDRIEEEGVANRWPLPEASPSELPPIDPVEFAASVTPKPDPPSAPRASITGTPTIRKPRPKTLARTSPAREASNLFRAARRFDSEGRRGEAVAAYRRVIEGYPDSPEARMSAAGLKTWGEE